MKTPFRLLVCFLFGGLIVIRLGASETISEAEPLTTVAKAEAWTDAFMDLLLNEGLDAAFDHARTRLITVPDDDLLAIQIRARRNLPMTDARYGKRIGVEPLRTEIVGESLMMIAQLEKRERHAIIWLFYFYQAEEEWTLNAFIFNDQIPFVFQ